jgi:hypothetical protein
MLEPYEKMQFIKLLTGDSKIVVSDINPTPKRMIPVPLAMSMPKVD